jgi:hypothetical protein
MLLLLLPDDILDEALLLVYPMGSRVVSIAG